MSFAQCSGHVSHVIKEFDKLRVSEFLSTVSFGQKTFHEQMLNNHFTPETTSQMCLGMDIIMKIIVPGIIASYEILVDKMNEANFLEADKLIKMYWAVIAVSFVIILGIVYIVLTDLFTMKSEILSMDTVKDLYNISEFQPELNRLLNGYQC